MCLRPSFITTTRTRSIVSSHHKLWILNYKLLELILDLNLLGAIIFLLDGYRASSEHFFIKCLGHTMSGNFLFDKKKN